MQGFRAETEKEEGHQTASMWHVTREQAALHIQGNTTLNRDTPPDLHARDHV
jgi:hypothetical protein